MYSILDKYGNKRCDVNSLEYRGEFMSISSVVVTIKSNKPIEFANGDYIVFRGEEFTLRYTPAILKQARKDTYGEAFVYENMAFYADSDELTRCDFLDVVKSDNNIHYTSLPNFSFYAESVQELADRIQANLNRLYTGDKAWSVTVADGTISKPHNFSCSNIKCWDALVLANTELDLNFVIRGRNIIIGDTGSVIDNNFAYGKNLGLKSINSTTSENSAIITRLRAYGSTRNIPYRYYNKLYINSSGVVKYFKEKPTSGWELLISESMYMPNLMLPMFRNSSLIGAEGNLYNEDGLLCGKYRLGGTIGEDAYIESVDGIEKYGVNEGTVFFDTEDEENEDNIYPSMSGMTAQDLINAGYSIQLDSGDSGNLDEILSAEVMTDDGYLPESGASINPSSFSVTLKDIGFDIGDYLLEGESAQIYFSSGELVGRTFEITAITKDGKKQILRLNRYLDEDIQWVFPNKYYNAKAGDKFVLLNIYMPDVYVAAAEFRLLERAKFYLADNDHNTINYAPSIDNIFLARNPEIAENIKEGNIFTFYDDDLGIHKSITISSIIIKIGESLIPEYEVTLSEDKDATLVDRITTEVSDNIGKTMFSASNIVSLSRLQFDKRYLRKTTEDTAEKKITFAEGLAASKVVSDWLVSIGFTPNFGGSGFSLEIVDGKSYLTVDNAYIRNKATFDELEIREVTHTGGVEIKSPASCKIANVAGYSHIAWVDANGQEIADKNGNEVMVLEPEGSIKCYFKASDGEKTIYNDWRVGDQALCQSFNVEIGSRYYWRRVIDVSDAPENGYHWVALSLTDGEGDTPMSGDTIVCFGSSNADRQAAIIMAANGTNSPCFVQLKGISSYRVDESNVVTLLSPTKNIIKGHQIVMVSEDGEKDVAAEFKVQSDMISSVVEATSAEFGEVRSEITQTADNIRLQVGNAGINLDNQNITLTAAKTKINGDLAVSVVKCYYDEEKTQIKSAYNGNGNGTIVYYYPNGRVMRQDAFVTDTSGNVLGMRTTYYKADGSVAWVLSEGGIQTTLDYYWEALNGGNALAYTDSTTTMMDICKQYLGEAMKYFSKSQFSRFVTQNNYADYNGKIAKGLKSSEKPDSVTLYSGVLVYSIELVEDGLRPVYQVAYEQVTTKLNQLSPIMTKKFNKLGEIN